MGKEILGSIYAEVSDDFQRGILPTARCIKAEKHDLAVIEMEVKQIGNLTESTSRDNPNRRRVYDTDGLSPTLTSAMGEGGNLQPFVVTERKLGNIYGFEGGNYAGNVYDSEALSPTIRTYQGGNQQPAVLEDICINDRGFTEKEPQVSIGMAPTLRAETHGNLPKVIEDRYRIRKLIPLECWRLMGFSDEDFHKAEKVNSNSQLYKQAGNSIVKNVLMAIFGQMLERN